MMSAIVKLCSSQSLSNIVIFLFNIRIILWYFKKSSLRCCISVFEHSLSISRLEDGFVVVWILINVSIIILGYLLILLDMCSAIVVSNSYVFEILVDNFHWIWLSKISWIINRPFWRIEIHLVCWFCLVDLWYCYSAVWSCLISWFVLILTARLISFLLWFFFFWWCWLKSLVLWVY